MRGRSWPWIAAAVVQAMGIVFLLVQLRTDPASAAPVDPDQPAGNDVTSVVVTVPAREAEPEAPRTASPPTALPAPGRPTPADLGTLLHGTVRIPAGSQPSWRLLSLFLGEDTKACATTSLRVDGGFAFPGLAAGDYRLTARADGLRNFEQAFTVPPDLPSMRIDVTLEASWIVKVVLLAPDGRPLHEVLAADKELTRGGPFELVNVIAAWQELPALLPLSDLRETPLTVGNWQSSRGFSRGRGSDLPARYAGTIEMREHRAGVIAAVMREVVLVQAPVQAGQDEVALTVDPQQLRAQFATVRLQVVNAATGKPVPDAKVGLNDAQSYGQPTPVDADGRFEQANLRPGRYRLSILAGDLVSPSAEVDLPPGRTTDLGAIAVAAPAELFLRVPALTDEPHASWSLWPLDAFANGAPRPTKSSLGFLKGEVHAKVLPGRYQVRVTHGGQGAMLEVDTRKLGNAPLTINLVPEPTLRLDLSQLDEPVRCVLRASNDAVVYDRWITWTTAFDLQVPAGSYRVRTERMRGDVRDDVLTVPAEGTKYVLQ